MRPQLQQRNIVAKRSAKRTITSQSCSLRDQRKRTMPGTKMSQLLVVPIPPVSLSALFRRSRSFTNLHLLRIPPVHKERLLKIEEIKPSGKTLEDLADHCK